MNDPFDYIPPRNQFDAVYSLNEADELGFINFKKLGKKIKKGFRGAGKGIKKAANWAVKKSPVAKVVKGTGKFIKKNKKAILTGVALAAGGAALAFGGAPLLAAGTKIGGKMVGIGANLLKGAKKAGAVALPFAQQYISNKTDAGTQAAMNEGEALGNDPQYQEALEQLRAQGMNDQQIAQQWLTSQAYYKQAVPQVAATVEPQLYAEYQSSGLPNAREMAAHDAGVVAVETVKDVQAKAGGGLEKLAIPAAFAALAFMLK